MGFAAVVSVLLLTGGIKLRRPNRRPKLSRPLLAESASSSEEVLPEGFSVTNNVISDYVWDIIKHWIETDEFRLEHKCAFVKEEIQESIKYPIPWEIGAQNRRVAQFGFRYNYEKDIVEFDDDVDEKTVPKIPSPLRDLLRLDEPIIIDGCTCHPHNFTQCIINVYDPDTIIPWHVDDKMFGPVVLVYTFGESRPLYLRRQRQQKIIEDETNKPNYISSNNSYQPFSKLYNDFRALDWKEEPEFIDPSLYEYAIANPYHGSRYILSGDSREDWEHAVPKGNGLRISFTFRTERQQEE